MVDHIKALFPKLASAALAVTSDPDQGYNCIAWAAGANNQRWWPLEDSADVYWPDSVPRIATLAAFQLAFATLGYTGCADDRLEADVEKIALFADVDGRPTHAARQLPSGRWTSKLGKAEDIEHNLRDLEGDIYGTVVAFMSRPLSTAHDPGQTARGPN